MKFIDWELGGYTYTAFDIADHFVWLAGETPPHTCSFKWIQSEVLLVRNWYKKGGARPYKRLRTRAPERAPPKTSVFDCLLKFV